MLFANVFLYDGKWKKKVGDWWNRTFEPKHLGKQPGKSFHSTRHSFINQFKQNHLKTREDEHILKAMVGHVDGLDADGGITLDRYGKPFTPKKMLRLLQKLDYEVDLELLEWRGK